jgi:hypothetical protein
MSIIAKQLILNHIGLTPEIIEMIKEYAFYDVIVKTKKCKNKIISLIKSSFHTPINFTPILSTTEYVFWIDDDDENGAQLQSEFCVKCGDYLYHETTNIVCKCIEV